MERTEAWRQLEAGAVLVTATHRLALHLRHAYDAVQQQAGRDAWESPDILPWDAWLRRAHERVQDGRILDTTSGGDGAGLLLGEGQAHAVWDALIGTDRRSAPLLQRHGVVRRAREAYQRLVAWRLEPPAPPAGAPPELAAFVDWYRGYEARCREQGWLDAAHLPARLRAALAQGAWRPPPVLIVAGFDEWTPLQQALLEALAAQGTALHTLAHPSRADRARRSPCADAATELRAMARWVEARLRAAATPPLIGVVVPELAERRQEVAAALEDSLQPEALLPGTTPRHAPFNISAGLPLAAYPLVDAALALLELTPAPQPYETLSTLLRSPFLGGAEAEWSARAVLDRRLRSRGVATMSPLRLAGPSASTTPHLARHVGQWRAGFADGPRDAPPGAWARHFDALLQAWGWPGERARTSAEQQTVEKWQELLQGLAALELVVPRQGRGAALALLRRLARDTPFQPERPPAPVQVLGPLEAGGLAFDHLWLLGLDESRWPPMPSPNPFLPLALQQAHGMPRASSERELEIARRETERMLRAAPDVMVSHALRSGDSDLRPSPLVAALPLADADPVPAPAGEAAAPALSPLWCTAAQGPALQTIVDAHAPALAEGTEVTGGTALFQDQAACPFRAFARHRLHARSLEDAAPGLDPLLRGTLVHAVLERVWARLGDQAALLALDAGGLEALVAACADAAVAEHAERHPERLGARLAALERRRLADVVLRFLALEKERPPFTVVEREGRHRIEVGGLVVEGRVDRRDEVATGGALILDYKTSVASVRSWWGERPDEPQLPLYAASGDFPVVGVAFAQVRSDELRFEGIADDGGLLPRARLPEVAELPEGTPPPQSVAELTAHWRAVLTALGTAHRAGEAAVDPKSAESCRHCDLPGLCRIAEQQPWHEVQEPNDA